MTAPIRDAVADGDRLESLRRLADRLAERLDDDSHNVHAQLSGQFRSTLEEIARLEGEAVQVEEEVSELERIRRRRSS